MVFSIGFLLSKKMFLLLWNTFVVAQLCLTLCDPMNCSTPGFPPCLSVSPGVCSNSHPLSWWCHPTLILCCPLLLLPSTFPSIRVISSESALLISWPQYWSFSFSINPSSEYSRLIFFRTDLFGIGMKTDFSRKYITKDWEKCTLISPTCSEIVQGETHTQRRTGRRKGCER